MSQFKSLPNLESLKEINRHLLIEFLTHFKSLIDPGALPVLSRELPPDDFYSALSASLADAEKLPTPIRDALAAIDDLASPKNRDRLDFALLHAPLMLDIDPHACAFQQALHLWLYKPYHLPPQLPEPAPEQKGAALAAAEQAGGELVAPKPSEAGTIQNQNSKFENSPDPLPTQNQNSKIKNGAQSIDPTLSAPHSNAPRSDALRLPLPIFFFELDQILFREFIRAFQTDLLAKYPKLPQPCPGNSHFIDAVGDLLAKPDDLPPRMYEALLAIQEMANPQNGPLLHALLTQSGIQPDDSWPQEDKALQFWLRCPFTIDNIDALRAQIPESVMNGSANGNGATPHLDNSPRSNAPRFDAPHSKLADRQVPGDLSAIARFPRHKISHLPPEVRDSINRMLRQRIPHAKILGQLGDLGKTLNKSNLSRWKKTGYLVWLAEQQRREDAQVQLQLLFDLLRENENGKIHEATQQIAALRISQVLAAFDPATLTQTLEKHPQSFVRLIQTLPSLSRGGMDCERILLDLSERKASMENKDRPGKRGISKQHLSYIEQKMKLL